MVALEVDWFFTHVDGASGWLHILTIPVFTGVIGWLINWSGLWMLFEPTRFHGVHVRGLRQVARALPRKLQEIPGLLEGGLGWQGIVPARAAKMGSIAVDKVIAKVGTPRDFYVQLEPDRIADHIVTVVEPDLPQLIDEIMRREHPRLWRDLPAWGKQQVVTRVQAQLPKVVHDVTDEIGEHIDQLLDPKIMVIEHFREHPDLVVSIFREVGHRELRMMVTFGFVFGFLLGIPVAVLDHWFGQWWLLPLLGIVVGWVTNKLGMWLIFQPVEEKQVLGVTVHGLFLRRQDEAAEVYARSIADDVITLERIGDVLMNGPRGDRTRQLLARALRPAIDDAAGPLLPVVRVAVGTSQFERIREGIAVKAADRTDLAFRDPEFGRQQGARLRELFARRTKELPPEDYVEMMRSAFREDEWMLYAHGAVMGFAGGVLHLLLFGVGGT